MNQTGVRSTGSRFAARASSGSDCVVEGTAGQCMGDLRLGIDVSPLELTEAGTARYLRNLLSHLDGVTVERYVVPGRSRSAKVRRDLLWYLRTLPRKAARDGVDVLHCPGHRGPLHPRVPLVVTLHDLAVLRHPETFNRWTRSYSRTMLPRIVEAATRVIAVSTFTAGEAVELLGVDEGKVRVVPHGVEPPFLPEGQEVRGEYALSVGTVEPRKNLPRAVEAAQRAGIELRVVGPEGWGNVGVQSLGFVSDEVLAALYRGAQCLVFPSLYGVRVARARGDGVRDAGRDDQLRSDRGARARCRRPRRPVRRGCDRRRDRRS